MRRLLAVLLLLSFFCQAYVTAGQSIALDHAGGFQAAHAEMHLEREAHHHDEEGLAHQDNSQDSIQHILADASGAVALFQFPQPLFHFGRSSAPAVTAESAGPPPYLDGLRRPPRLIS
ncbi:MAG TPA: hypothetical protein DCW87_04565 [Comamonadaceae bacterium]|nr:hypothetical protein [Comamonadaceae bacterium]